jgi:hypothetical protein
MSVDQWTLDMKMNASQSSSMHVIQESAAYFCSSCGTNLNFPIWKDVVANCSIDYNLDECSIVFPLKLAELLPGLPERGVAGTLA